jgi:hypothetical protein
MGFVTLNVGSGRIVRCKKPLPPITHSRVKMAAMAKKTGISDSSLWIVTVLLLVLTAWMYFKR